MRRLGAIALVLIAAGCAGSLGLSSPATRGGSTHFAVIFDDARGLEAGQQVKVAGAPAGTITRVSLTSDYKARIEASIDPRFGEFRQDSSCTIRLAGLIEENYLQCDPGSADSPPLPSSDGQPPTVPVSHTTEPVTAIDLFNTFSLPTRERVRMILDELGIATSGRGADLNELIRRANPALGQVRSVLAILRGQEAQLGTIIDATNTVASSAARHPAEVRGVLGRAAAVLSETGGHRNDLSVAVDRLPVLLGAAQPALEELNGLATGATPIVDSARAAIPSLDQLRSRLTTFVSAAAPSLARLTPALARAIPALSAARPAVSALGAYEQASGPDTRQAGELLTNLQRKGFIESFLSLFYYLSAATARYDSVSHIVPAYAFDYLGGACSAYAATPVAGCNAHYARLPGSAARAFRPPQSASPLGPLLRYLVR